TCCPPRSAARRCPPRAGRAQRSAPRSAGPVPAAKRPLSGWPGRPGTPPPSSLAAPPGRTAGSPAAVRRGFPRGCAPHRVEPGAPRSSVHSCLLRRSRRGGGPSRVRQCRLDRLEGLVVHRRVDEPALERARRRVHPALEQLVEERAVPPGLLVLHLLVVRSEEHTSELQSRENLVCRL